jgi:antitoxin PrlF
MIAVSNVSIKAQTVLPKTVRDKLGLKLSDAVRYVIEGDRVTISKHNAPAENPFHAFTEWDSPADEEAYGRL